jgi:transcriptional regulator with XRE-family HTH domain
MASAINAQMNGELVREWLKKKGQRPEDLASRLHVSIGTVRRILTGEDNLSYPTIMALAHLTGIPEEQLKGEGRIKRAKSA